MRSQRLQKYLWADEKYISVSYGRHRFVCFVLSECFVLFGRKKNDVQWWGESPRNGFCFLIYRALWRQTISLQERQTISLAIFLCQSLLQQNDSGETCFEMTVCIRENCAESFPKSLNLPGRESSLYLKPVSHEHCSFSRSKSVRGDPKTYSKRF